jgi:hypothetical protein
MNNNGQGFRFKSDRAITDLTADRLDRSRFVESLSRTIISPDGRSATGVTVGLVGRWGEGKSSILRLLHNQLLETHPQMVVVEFSPWLVSQRHDLLRAFFHEFGRSIERKFAEYIHVNRRSQVRYDDLRALLVPSFVKTARDVNRLVAAFAHRLGLVAGDVEWVDVLGFVALALNAPDLAEHIRQSPDSFVFDGSIAVHASRQTFDEFFKSVATRSEQESATKELFGFLFPAISRARRLTDCFMDEIAFRRPLLTLLRMKTLSTEVSKDDVIELTRMSGQQLDQAMAAVAQAGKAVSFAERFVDLARHGQLASTADVWTALMKAINDIPQTEWAVVLMRMLALRDVPDVIATLVSRDIGFEKDLREVIQSLARSDSYDAAAILIRKVMMNIERSSSAFRDALLNAGMDEPWLHSVGQGLVSRAKGWARTNSKLLSTGIAYLAERIAAWDDQDRRRYSGILQASDRAFDRFIVDCFGANYATDGTTIDKLFMPLDQFRRRLRERQAEIGTSGPIELRQAYEKAVEWLGMEPDDMAEESRP